MVNPSLQQWRKKNCTVSSDKVALSRFLGNTASRENTPNKPMAIDSPFSLASLSPLSPLVALTTSPEEDTVLLEGIHSLVESDLPLEIPLEIDEESSKAGSESNSDNDAPKEEEESPRRSTRRKTKRIENVTSTRSRARPSRAKRPTAVKTTAPKTQAKRRPKVDDVFVEQPEGESRKCSCKKSKCLKLYCECFSAGVLCDPGCKCTDCSNTADNVAARRKAVAYKLSRKPKAFTQKIVETADAKDGAVHSKGCNCKRSGCQKKYCECYQGGVACSDACKCVGCKNDGNLMHLRDLGVAGWKAPSGGFNQAAHGMMSMMVIVPPSGFIEEPIPLCDSEVALHKLLITESIKRQMARAASVAPPPPAPEHVPEAATVWPVAKPKTPTAPAQVTPRSGTSLEPYPSNQKRRCQKKTPKSFGSRITSPIDEDSIDMGDLETVFEESEDKLPKGIKHRAKWSDGEVPGYYHNDDGKLCWGMPNAGENDVNVDTAVVDSVEFDTIENPLEDLTTEIALEAVGFTMPAPEEPFVDTPAIKTEAEREDAIMREVEGAMADLLTPRFTDLLTPRLQDLIGTPRSCRSNVTPRSLLPMDTEYDWDTHICTPRGDWDQLSTTPRAIAAC